MFKFLLGKTGLAKGQPSQREVMVALLADLNTAISALPEKPAVTIDPEAGTIDLALPDQFPDEALALPAPSAEETAEPPQAEGAQDAPKAEDAPTPEAKPKKAPAKKRKTSNRKRSSTSA